MKFCIATLRAPESLAAAQEIYRQMSEVASDYDVILCGMLWAPGPNCVNLAIEILGRLETCERFMRVVIRSMEPCKVGITPDHIPPGLTLEDLNPDA